MIDWSEKVYCSTAEKLFMHSVIFFFFFFLQLGDCVTSRSHWNPAVTKPLGMIYNGAIKTLDGKPILYWPHISV